MTAELGSLSRRYESGGNPAAIGYDGVGGWSYGLYQLATRVGSMVRFIAWLAKYYKDFAGSLEAAGGAAAAEQGRGSFKAAWQALADDPLFATAQHGFIKATYYDVLADELKGNGLDIAVKSAALRDVVWSVAVQHGAHTGLIIRVLAAVGLVDDAALIKAIYAERRTRFGGSTQAIRDAVNRRFDDECRRALAMLAEEEKGLGLDKPSLPEVEAPMPAVQVGHAVPPAPMPTLPGDGFFSADKMRDL